MLKIGGKYRPQPEKETEGKGRGAEGEKRENEERRGQTPVIAREGGKKR